jgi:hypothetical protein
MNSEPIKYTFKNTTGIANATHVLPVPRSAA